MAFLSDMPSRNAANFSLMLSGDARAGGSYHQPAAGITNYIALNDTRPPEGQVIGMCQGHSVLGYNWHQHVSSCPTADKQRGLKRPVSSVGGGGSVPSASSSTASASKPAPPGVDIPQLRNTEMSVQGCGSGGIRSAASGSRDAAESSCDDDNDAMQASDAAASSLSKSKATNAAAGRSSRGLAVASQGEESVHRGRSFGARGFLGGNRTGNKGGACSTAAGRDRREVPISGEGETPEGAAVAAATTRGRVGMRKARRTYGR